MLISYKREDQLPARQLADVFERQGWSVWWDPKLRAGERFDDVIEKALIAARCFVVVWSRRSIDSTYVKDEATYALNRNKLFPLSIEEVELPFRFEWIHTPRLIDWDGKEEAPAFQSILRDIIVIIGPSPGMEEMRQIQQESDLTADRPELESVSPMRDAFAHFIRDVLDLHARPLRFLNMHNTGRLKEIYCAC